MLKIYISLKQISKKISALSTNICKKEVRCFLDLTSDPGWNEVPPKSIPNMNKQKNNILIPLIHPSVVDNEYNNDGWE